MVSVLVKIFWDNNPKISVACNSRHLFLICEPVAWLSSVRLSFESAPHVPDSKEQQIPAMCFLCRWQKQDFMVTLKASSWTCANIAAHIPLVKAGNLSKFNAPGQGGVLHLGAGGWDMSICVKTIQPTRTSLGGQVKELRILLWSRGQIQLLQMKEGGRLSFGESGEGVKECGNTRVPWSTSLRSVTVGLLFSVLFSSREAYRAGHCSLSLRLKFMCKPFSLDWAALEQHHLVPLGEEWRSWWEHYPHTLPVWFKKYEDSMKLCFHNSFWSWKHPPHPITKVICFPVS